MKQKRVLFIEFLKVTAANHLLMMIKGLLPRKDCIIVVLCQKDSFLARELKKINVLVYELDYLELNLHQLKTYFPFLKVSLLVLLIIIKYKINIIHSHRLNWAYLGIAPSILFRIPLFVHIVIIEKLSSKFQNLLLQYHKNIKYIAVSKTSLEQFKKLYNVPTKNITYHYGGLFFPDLIKNHNTKISWLEKLKNKKNIIAMVSRMDPLKGVDIFIESAAILHSKYSNLYFIHIGNHSEYIFQQGYYEDCLKRVDNLGIKNYISFLDYRENILTYYKYFYLLALPTLKDTLSYVNLEANFFKVPVIFTDIDGLMETSMAEFSLSIPYPPSSVLLASKLEQLLQDKAKYEFLQEEVSKYINQYFNSEKNAAHLVKIYESVL